MGKARFVLVTFCLAATLVAQQNSASKTSTPQAGRSLTNFTLASPAFGSGASIPDRFTCAGTDVSPALAWTRHPSQAVSFALVMDDPDAPAGTWVHWLMWNIPANSHLLQADVAKSGSVASGAMQGRNDFGRVGYSGPCPPPGKVHRYFFRLYALDAKLTLRPGATRQELGTAMKGHFLATAEHIGTYRR